MEKNIALVGFMGAGKTSVAKGLAASLKRDSVSTDSLIEAREKRVIADIFKDSGEAYFRAIEKEVVSEIAQRKNLIIDCGGGVVLKQENIDNLKKNGVVIYLCASPEVIYQRVKGRTHRPLLNVANPQEAIRELLFQRRRFYEKADYTVETADKTPQEVVEAILKLFSHG